MKKVIVLLIICFLVGCSNTSSNNLNSKLVIHPEKYEKLEYNKLYSANYDINKDGINELLVIGENEYDKYIIDIIYKVDNVVLSVCSYGDCRINIYDNGIIFNTVFNSYSEGMFILNKLNDGENIYYYKYDTDTDYFVYEDRDFKKKSKYQSVNDLLDYYAKDSKKIKINELELSEV